jgi:hypothetical protein
VFIQMDFEILKFDNVIAKNRNQILVCQILKNHL